MLSLTLLLPFLITTIRAQAGPEAFSIFNSTGRLPDGCIDGYTAGRDEYLYTVPYTYAQVLSIIGSFAVRPVPVSGHSHPLLSIALQRAFAVLTC